MMPEDIYVREPITPLWTHEFTGLIGDWHITNCSLMPYRQDLLLAYRSGWYGSKVYVAKIHEGMRAGESVEIKIDHELAAGGAEDPRLFVFENKLHMAFTGVRVTSKHNTIGRQLIARLSDDFVVEKVWEPEYLWTTQWEKNWQIFANGGGLYAVYSMNPWRVVHLINGKAEPISEIEDKVKWRFGLPRGGALPVRHGGEFYCFFHGTDHSGRESGGLSMYTMGVLTFDVKYPFNPLRMTKEPILWPITSDLAYNKELDRRHDVACVFPCGAYHDEGQWVVSYGHNDKACRVSAFGDQDIEERLCPI